MGERQIQNGLESLLAHLMDAQRRGVDKIDMPVDLGKVAGILTFDRADEPRLDKGQTLRMANGREFDLTITRRR